jgi:PhnB protein
MASQLNPYLQFDGNAREAMEYYKSFFGGELTINTFGQFGNSDPAVADRVMHAQLKNDKGYVLMASDTAPGMPYSGGGNVTVSLTGDADEGLAEAWEKLSAGGQVTMPFEKQVWGDTFGMCVDRFGIAWMVNMMQG